MIAHTGRALGLTLAGLALIFALFGLVGPLALGGPVRQAYQDLLASVLDGLPVGWVVLERYDRGWFSSSASAELALQPTRGSRLGAPGAPAPLGRIRLDSQIEQGPLIWLATLPRPILARVRTRVDWSQARLPLPPLAIETELAADGGALARLHLPAGEKAGADGAYRVRSGEAAGTVRYEPKTKRLRLDIGLPDLELIAPTRGGGAAVGVPLASLAGARLGADLTGWIGGLYTGSTRIEIGSARLAPGTAGTGGTGAIQGAAVAGLKLELDQTPREGLLDLSLDLGAESFRLGAADYRDGRLGLSARSLNGNALAELIAALRALGERAASPAMRGLVGATLVSRLLPQLAAGGARLAVDPLRLETAAGPVSGHLSLTLGTADPAAADAQPAAVAVLDALAAEGELALPRAVALDWLARASAADDESPQQRLARFGADGWVYDRDGRVGSVFKLANGLLTVNGKTLPLLGSAAGQ